MLTTNQVIKLYDVGVKIKFKRKQHPRGLKGQYDPSTLEILIYRPSIESTKDRDITILHEFIEAREDTKAVRSSGKPCEVGEREAKMTYHNRPYVLELIKEMYNIR